VGTLRKYAGKARDARRALDSRQVFFTWAVHLIVVSCTVALTLASGLLVAPITGIVHGTPANAEFLFLFSVGCFLLLFVIHFFWVFLGGWQYPYRAPLFAKRGTPRSWYNAIKNSGQEKEQLAAVGFTLAFVETWRARRNSINLTNLFSAILLFSTLAMLLTAYNLLVEKAFLTSATQVSGSIFQTVRDIMAKLLGEPLTEKFELTHQAAVIAYIVPCGLSVLFGAWLVQKSRSIRWALLPLPEILWKYLYHFEMYKNRAVAGYTDDDGQDDAYRWILLFALEACPEEFFSDHGKMFFIEDATVKEFEQFVESHSPSPT
jgi:hypothetical protein